MAWHVQWLDAHIFSNNMTQVAKRELRLMYFTYEFYLRCWTKTHVWTICDPCECVRFDFLMVLNAFDCDISLASEAINFVFIHCVCFDFVFGWPGMFMVRMKECLCVCM